jgi:hypothetical protein
VNKLENENTLETVYAVYAVYAVVRILRYGNILCIGDI